MRALVGRIDRRFPDSSRETLRGYEHPELVDVIFRKTLAYKPTGEWPEIAGASTVLDFGGGCGLHYREANSKTVRWAVVETPAMVAKAKELETDKLRFFTDIDEAVKWLGPIDVMHSNGALQYASKPKEALHRLCGLRAKTMLWKRVTLSAGETEQETQRTILGDNGPGKSVPDTRNVEYTRTSIPEEAFLLAHHGYDLIGRGEDWFTFAERHPK
jgi:putative methyltransferase (TIGR04325 family)